MIKFYNEHFKDYYILKDTKPNEIGRMDLHWFRPDNTVWVHDHINFLWDYTSGSSYQDLIVSLENKCDFEFVKVAFNYVFDKNKKYD